MCRFLAVSVLLSLSCSAEKEGIITGEPGEDPCLLVDLSDGAVDGTEEFWNLFDCLNKDGTFDALRPLFLTLEETTNEETGESLLLDLVSALNVLLYSGDMPDLLSAFRDLLEDPDHPLDGLLLLFADAIDAGVAEAFIPITGAAASLLDAEDPPLTLPATSTILKYEGMPELLQALKGLIDGGAVKTLLPDLATLFTATDQNGQLASLSILPAMGSLLHEEQAREILPLVDETLDSGTAYSVMEVFGKLYAEGALSDLPQDIRPLFAEAPDGTKAGGSVQSTFEILLRILKETDRPLTCLYITIFDNLAESILYYMADYDEETIQGFVDFFMDYISGIAGSLCDIDQDVLDNLEALDTLAESGALGAGLPVLRAFKEKEQMGTLKDLLVSLHDSGAVPYIRPVVVLYIDEGIFDNTFDVLFHLVDPVTLEPNETFHVVVEVANDFISPLTGDDYSTSLIFGLLPFTETLLMTRGLELGYALYQLGVLMEEDEDFMDLLWYISQLIEQDPEGETLLLMADLLDNGVVEMMLPIVTALVDSGSMEEVLPFLSEIIRSGLVTALLDYLAQIFALMEL